MSHIVVFLQEVLNNFMYFLSTNHTPGQHKVIVSMLVVTCFGITIFILSYLLHNIRNLDLLKVKRYDSTTCAKWTAGAVLLNFILVVTQVANYNIITFLVTAMIWDTLYHKIFKQTKGKKITAFETIDKKSGNTVE